MATAVVKWDKNGNPMVSGKGTGEKPKKRRMVKLDVSNALKSAAPAIGYGLVGAVAAGVGYGVVAMVPPLRRWAAEGGMKRAVVVGGTSLAVAGVGLVIASRFTTPKKVMEAAPFVLGGTALVAFAPVIAKEIVERIDGFMAGFMRGATPTTSSTPAGAGRMGGMRPRRALNPDQVLSAQQQVRSTVNAGVRPTRW